jgi:hypothetical protein
VRTELVPLVNAMEPNTGRDPGKRQAHSFIGAHSSGQARDESGVSGLHTHEGHSSGEVLDRFSNLPLVSHYIKMERS